MSAVAATRICANPACFREVPGLVARHARYCCPKCRDEDKARREAMKKICAYPECGKRFLPRVYNQKYCCPECGKDHYYRRKGWKPTRVRTATVARGKWGLERCPFEAGDIKMPDGGRWPDAGWGI